MHLLHLLPKGACLRSPLFPSFLSCSFSLARWPVCLVIFPGDSPLSLSSAWPVGRSVGRGFRPMPLFLSFPAPFSLSSAPFPVRSTDREFLSSPPPRSPCTRGPDPSFFSPLPVAAAKRIEGQASMVKGWRGGIDASVRSPRLVLAFHASELWPTTLSLSQLRRFLLLRYRARPSLPLLRF